LAGLANHKLVLLPASLALVTAMTWFRSKEARKSFLHPALIGFAAGTALFWGHGFLIDAAAFWKEHVRTHLFDRVIHHNPLGYSGYPKASELWAEFSKHTGYALLPLGLIALLLSLIRRQQAADPLSESLPFPLSPITLRAWAVWMVVMSLVYSLVDWRMTKHLTPLFLPLIIVPAAWSHSGWVARLIVTVTFSGLFVWNVTALRTIIQDFTAFTITPAW
jgi:hypothetical protein